MISSPSSTDSLISGGHGGCLAGFVSAKGAAGTLNACSKYCKFSVGSENTFFFDAILPDVRRGVSKDTASRLPAFLLLVLGLYSWLSGLGVVIFRFVDRPVVGGDVLRLRGRLGLS